jgi:hypothetical protein
MEKDYERIVRENERLKAALRAVESYCASAVFGGWRSDILALVRNAWRAT